MKNSSDMALNIIKIYVFTNKIFLMKLTQRKAILVVAILIVIACFFAVYLRLFTGKELWYEMFAAVLGVIITAVITMILLKGQSDDDVERERAAKIFEEKLRIYQDYLHTLCDVIKDHSLSDGEKIRLEFQTSYVAMHCDSKYIATVSNAVKELIEYCCPDEDGENLNRKNKSGSPDPLLDNLFCIVEAFRKDLYGDDFKFDDRHKQDTLENFSNAYRNAKSSDYNVEQEQQQRITVDLNVLSNSLANAAGIGAVSEKKSDEQNSKQQVKAACIIEDTSIWDKALSEWEKESWHVEGMSDQYDGFIMTNTNGNPGVIKVEFWQGHYCIHATYAVDSDFSKPLKWEKGGRRNYGHWWQYLAEPYCNIVGGKFVETFKSDKELQQYIIDNVDQLKDIITRHHRTTTWKKGVGSYENWDIFIWYWDMLVCQLYSDGERTLYMDIIEDGNSGNVLIQFANRKDDNEMLKNALKRMGCQDKETNANGYVVLEVVPSTDAGAVSERVKYWIEKING